MDLIPYQITVGEIVYPPGGSFGPRIQPSVQLVFVHSGSMSVSIDGVQHETGPRTGCILFPGYEERFQFARQEATHHSWVHLFFTAFPPALQERFERLPWSLSLTHEMNDLIRTALLLQNTSLSTVDQMMKALGMQMLWRYLGEGERSEPGHRLVEKAQEFIHDSITQPLTLEQIARASAVSPAHLTRLFRSRLGQTPMAYVWQRRVKLGVELLKSTGLPIGVIAEQCGFQTSYHFSRRIRQETGFSPSEIRQQNGSNR
jgi:AraC-like DNA-binding protein